MRVLVLNVDFEVDPSNGRSHEGGYKGNGPDEQAAQPASLAKDHARIRETK